MSRLRRLNFAATAAATAAIAVLALAPLGACGKKQDAPPAPPAPTTALGSGAGSAAGSAAGSTATPPVTCPPGSLADNGACVAVITAEAVTALKTQASRIDELLAVLAKVDAVSGPIELLAELRKEDAWQKLVAASSKFKAIDDVAVLLDRGVKALRTFHDELAANAGRFGQLQVELDGLLTRPDVAATLAGVRAKVSAEVRAVVEPLAGQLQGVLNEALTPLATQLGDVADLIGGACAMAKLSGGDSLKALCTKQREIFGAALTYIAEVRDRPATLLLGVTEELLKRVPALLDAETTKLVGAAQGQLTTLLKLPAGATAGSGSAPGSGSGSGSAAGNAP